MKRKKSTSLFPRDLVVEAFKQSFVKLKPGITRLQLAHCQTFERRKVPVRMCFLLPGCLTERKRIAWIGIRIGAVKILNDIDKAACHRSQRFIIALLAHSMDGDDIGYRFRIGVSIHNKEE